MKSTLERELKECEIAYTKSMSRVRPRDAAFTWSFKVFVFVSLVHMMDWMITVLHCGLLCLFALIISVVILVL